MQKQQALQLDKKLHKLGEQLQFSYAAFVITLIKFVDGKGYELLGFKTADEYLNSRIPDLSFKQQSLREMSRLSRSLAKIYGSSEEGVFIADKIFQWSKGRLSYLYESIRYNIKGHENSIKQMIESTKTIGEFMEALKNSKIPPLHAARGAGQEKRRSTQTLSGYERIRLDDTMHHRWAARAEQAANETGVSISWEHMSPEDRGKFMEQYIQNLENK